MDHPRHWAIRQLKKYIQASQDYLTYETRPMLVELYERRLKADKEKLSYLRSITNKQYMSESLNKK